MRKDGQHDGVEYDVDDIDDVDDGVDDGDDGGGGDGGGGDDGGGKGQCSQSTVSSVEGNPHKEEWLGFHCFSFCFYCTLRRQGCIYMRGGIIMKNYFNGHLTTSSSVASYDCSCYNSVL